MAICPVKAYAKAEDGVVLHNPELCIGCKACQAACPYKAPTFNNATMKMSKCDMCFARRQEGLEPYCVAACPMEAISISDFDTIDESLYEVSSTTSGRFRISYIAEIRHSFRWPPITLISSRHKLICRCR